MREIIILLDWGDLAVSLNEVEFRLGPVFMSQDPLKKVGLM